LILIALFSQEQVGDKQSLAIEVVGAITMFLTGNNLAKVSVSFVKEVHLATQISVAQSSKKKEKENKIKRKSGEVKKLLITEK